MAFATVRISESESHRQFSKNRQALFSQNYVLSCPFVSIPVHSCHIHVGCNAVAAKTHGIIRGMKVTGNAVRCSAGFLTCCIADFQSAGHRDWSNPGTKKVQKAGGGVHFPKLTKTDRF